MKLQTTKFPMHCLKGKKTLFNGRFIYQIQIQFLYYCWNFENNCKHEPWFKTPFFKAKNGLNVEIAKLILFATDLQMTQFNRNESCIHVDWLNQPSLTFCIWPLLFILNALKVRYMDKNNVQCMDLLCFLESNITVYQMISNSCMKKQLLAVADWPIRILLHEITLHFNSSRETRTTF